MQILSNKDKLSIAVIHLVWIPYGIELFRSFIASYQKYSACASHNLVIIFNGVNNKAELDPYHQLLEKEELTYKSFYYKKGQDLECYFKTATKISEDCIFILNSYSILLANGWLEKYINVFLLPNIGIISATASNQSYYSSVFQKNKLRWETNNGFKFNFKKYKLFLKAFFYWRFLFKSYPNPHLRTNAFMIRRELFLRLKYVPFTSKFKAYQFESGRNNMTNQVLKMGYKALVVDKNGTAFEPAAWRSSRTFWCNEQEGLLVSDNQTRLYDSASSDEKKTMTKLAWNE